MVLGSLKNLTDKVQKEVERAEELDQNILKSLESDSRSFSFIDELMKISSTISDELKRVLFKLLQEGPQVVNISFFFFILIFNCIEINYKTNCHWYILGIND